MSESTAVTLRGIAAGAACLMVIAAAGIVVPAVAGADESVTIERALIGEVGAKTPEISTDELRAALAHGSAAVLDTRSHAEFAMGHIPGALNVSAKPGIPASMYVSDVAEIGRVLGGRKDTTIILYCNGPFCGKSKRLAEELLADGYTKVRRYQLGIPVWRALGGVAQIEDDGLRRVIGHDETAVFIDTRDSSVFAAGSVAVARNIPRGAVLEGKDIGEVKRAKDDGRLPMDDHNTRIVVLGTDGREARDVAEALTREAFHNVAFYDGTFAQAQSVLKLVGRRR
jgi:rhodanese-related sulfurtransferase